MNVMDLVAKISLDSQDYEKGIGDAKSSFAGLGSSIASGAKSIAKVGVATFTAIGTAIGGATTALIANAKETASYADNIDKMSQKMGMSAEKFQEWDFIMQHSGSSIDAVKGAMVKLEKAVDADSEAFKRLGLNQATLQDMSKEEQWESVVKHLQSIEDQTEKAELANEIFGKSYQELMPLLNSTNEDVSQMKEQVHALGGVMSDDAVKAGAQFQDSLQNLKTALTGAKNNLMGEFLPSLSTVMDGLSALFSGDESGIGKVKEGIESFAEKLNEKLPQVIQTIGGIANSLISALPALFETVADQLPSILEQAIPTLINAVVALSDSIVKALPKLLSAIQSNIGTITSGISKIVSAIGKIILQLAPTILPMMLKVAVQLIQELARGFTENASEVIRTVIEIINMLVQELTNPETLMTILECGLQILTALVNGIAENLPLLLETLGTLVVNITTFLIEAIPELVTNIGQNGAKIITEVIPQILVSLGEALGNLLFFILNDEGIGGWLSDIIGKAKTVFEGIGQGVMDAVSWIKEKVDGLASDILGWIEDGLKGIFDIGKNLMAGLWDGIQNCGSYIWDGIKGVGEAVLDVISAPFEIFSPSHATARMGKYLMQGLAVGVEQEADKAFDTIGRAMQDGMDEVELDALSLDVSANMKPSKSGASFSSTEGILMDIYNILDMMQRNGFTFDVPVYIGQTQFAEQVYNSKQMLQKRSGGQVDG